MEIEGVIIDAVLKQTSHVPDQMVLDKKLKKFVYPKQNNGKLYDLSIENVHSYYANGILISNCFVEFGTNRQRPNPFIRNTINNKLHNIIVEEIQRYYD